MTMLFFFFILLYMSLFLKGKQMQNCFALKYEYKFSNAAPKMLQFRMNMILQISRDLFATH